MKFEKLSKNKNQKRIIILSIIGIILLIGGITFYRTFALYEEKKEFNVLKGKIVAGKTKIIAKIDGVETTMPKKEVLFMEDLSCTNGIKSSWDYKSWKITTEESLKNSTCTISFLSPKNFAEYIEYKRYQDDSIEEVSHSATYQTPDLTDYRYTGANPDNYVCFGSEASPCPEENLYRVIGVIPTQIEENGEYINRVKLIKATNYANSYWSGNSNLTTNDWSKSSLNTYQLNNVYLNGLNQEYIDFTKWYLGGILSYPFSAEESYNAERGYSVYEKSSAISIIAKIGLMYPSDYGYATSGGDTSKETCLSNLISWHSSCAKNNWLYQNSYNEWLITARSSTANTTWFVYKEGTVAVSSYSTVNSVQFSIRPTFYLKEDVQYKSGNGRKSDPYRITIN